MLAWTYGDKKPRTEARVCLLPNLVLMLKQNNDAKGYFSELGSAQCCHRLGYEKYNFYRKGSVFQVLMEKITQCSGLQHTV